MKALKFLCMIGIGSGAGHLAGGAFCIAFNRLDVAVALVLFGAGCLVLGVLAGVLEDSWR